MGIVLLKGPASTLAGIRRHAFYDDLLTAQDPPGSVSESFTGTGMYPASLTGCAPGRPPHDLGGLPLGCLQLRVSRWPLIGRRSRVEPRTRGGRDVLGHAIDIGLRQLTDSAGTDEPGLLTRLVPDLPAAVLDCDAEGSDLR